MSNMLKIENEESIFADHAILNYNTTFGLPSFMMVNGSELYENNPFTLNILGTDCISLPMGLTSERPPATGSPLLRFNTELAEFETYTPFGDSVGWGPLISEPDDTTELDALRDLININTVNITSLFAKSASLSYDININTSNITLLNTRLTTSTANIATNSSDITTIDNRITVINTELENIFPEGQSNIAVDIITNRSNIDTIKNTYLEKVASTGTGSAYIAGDKTGNQEEGEYSIDIQPSRHYVPKTDDPPYDKPEDIVYGAKSIAIGRTINNNSDESVAIGNELYIPESTIGKIVSIGKYIHADDDGNDEDDEDDCSMRVYIGSWGIMRGYPRTIALGRASTGNNKSDCTYDYLAYGGSVLVGDRVSKYSKYPSFHIGSYTTTRNMDGGILIGGNGTLCHVGKEMQTPTGLENAISVNSDNDGYYANIIDPIGSEQLTHIIIDGPATVTIGINRHIRGGMGVVIGDNIECGNSTEYRDGIRDNGTPFKKWYETYFNGLISIGSYHYLEYETHYDYNDKVDVYATAIGTELTRDIGTTTIGNNIDATRSLSGTAIGNGLEVLRSENSIVIGKGSIVEGSNNCISLGNSVSSTDSDYAINIGTSVNISLSSTHSVAIGSTSNAGIIASPRSTMVGSDNKINSSNNGVVIGNGSDVLNADNGVAIGSNINNQIPNNTNIGIDNIETGNIVMGIRGSGYTILPSTSQLAPTVADIPQGHFTFYLDPGGNAMVAKNKDGTIFYAQVNDTESEWN